MSVPKFLLYEEASLKLLLDWVIPCEPNIAAVSHGQLLRQLCIVTSIDTERNAIKRNFQQQTLE